MSSSITVERIRKHPKFQQLVTRRSRLSWALLSVILIAYYSMTTLVAFWPGILRRPITEGAMTNVGIVFGVAIIVLGWALTWIYVRRANGEFDDINSQILNEVQK